MPYPTTNNIGPTNNPITNSLYSQDASPGLIVPGPAEFIVTESGLKITTEDGKYLITES